MSFTVCFGARFPIYKTERRFLKSRVIVNTGRCRNDAWCLLNEQCKDMFGRVKDLIAKLC